MNYKELAEQALDYIVEQRRWCHQNPELSLEEVQTTEHIAAELQKMGYTEIQRFPDHTGLCAMLRGGKAEKACRTVALRADIDALPVEEKTGLPFASRNKGVMHACGHDCHISMLLGAAKMLFPPMGHSRIWVWTHFWLPQRLSAISSHLSPERTTP